MCGSMLQEQREDKLLSKQYASIPIGAIGFRVYMTFFIEVIDNCNLRWTKRLSQMQT